MSVGPMTLGEALTSHSLFRLYGTPIKDVSLEGFSRIAASALTHFAAIRAYAVGDFCTVLPAPALVLVPGPGEKPDPEDKCARSNELVWNVLPTDRTVALTSNAGAFADILDEISTRGIDGGIQLSNPRIQNGQACVDIRVWAKIEIFGAKVDFDKSFPVCVPLEGCHTVWEIGWANLEICFRAPNQLCAKLCVGKWGISKCWDACVALPIPHASTTSVTSCGCQKTS